MLGAASDSMAAQPPYKPIGTDRKLFAFYSDLRSVFRDD
jgi:hypothetical protein